MAGARKSGALAAGGAGTGGAAPRLRGAAECQDRVEAAEGEGVGERRPDCPLASPEDMTIPVCVEDGPSIIEIVRARHAAWKVEQGTKP